jgi:hypothetical protein
VTGSVEAKQLLPLMWRDSLGLDTARYRSAYRYRSPLTERGESMARRSPTQPSRPSTSETVTAASGRRPVGRERAAIDLGEENDANIRLKLWFRYADARYNVSASPHIPLCRHCRDVGTGTGPRM